MGSRRGSEHSIGQNFNMKLLLLLASYAIAHGGDDYHMFKNWAQTKAMESCWGEENMKIYTVNMKKAVAKCHQVDAPELELPPFRSIDRMVNTLVSHANKMESHQFEKLYRMMTFINENHYNQRSHHNNYDSMSYMKNFNNNKDDAVLPVQRSVMPSFRGTTDFEKMANIMLNFRSKREANDALALNDRLKEKIQAVFEEQQAKIGNMTCVLKEMNCLNDENEIDVRAMKKDAEQYNLPSAWFKE